MRRTSGLLLATIFALGAPAGAEELSAVKRGDPLKPVPDGGIYVGGGSGFTPGDNTPLVTGALAIDRPLFWRIGLALGGEWFYLFREPESHFGLRLTVGPRIDILRTASKSVRWVAAVSFAHQHQAPVSTWLDSPGESVGGSSEHGLGHRSGVDVSTALVLTPWIEHQGFERRLRFLVRASGQWLGGSGPSFFVSAMTLVGVAI